MALKLHDIYRRYYGRLAILNPTTLLSFILIHAREVQSIE